MLMYRVVSSDFIACDPDFDNIIPLTPIVYKAGEENPRQFITERQHTVFDAGKNPCRVVQWFETFYPYLDNLTDGTYLDGKPILSEDEYEEFIKTHCGGRIGKETSTWLKMKGFTSLIAYNEDRKTIDMAFMFE